MMHKNLLFLLFFAVAVPFSSHASLAFCALDSIPHITCPGSSTISTDASACAAVYPYVVTASDDLPGWVLSQTAGLPSGAAFPLGATFNQYVVTDVAGQKATCSFTVTVKDFSPPATMCPASITVSVGEDEPNDCYLPINSSQLPGVAWISAAVFDNGSFDNCGSVLLTVRRLAPYSTFVETLNHVNGHPPCNDVFPDFPSEFEQAISERDSIKFYCKESGTTQPVILRAYQINADGSIGIGPNGLPVYGECVVQVKVEDKTKPLCTPPPEVVVTCEQFDPSFATYGQTAIFDNCCLSHVSKTVDYSQFDTLCSRGTLTRNFSVYDCSGNSAQCSQRVVVTTFQRYYVKFPDDTLATVCNSSGIYGRPVFDSEACALMGVSYEDQIFGLPVVDACFKIERTWTIINWCTYNPSLPLIQVPNPTLINTPYTVPANTPGPVVSACDAPAPWAPTISKIIPSDVVETNFCTFWSADANGYRYKQIVKILDTMPPLFVTCPTSPAVYPDSTANNVAYWNNVFNPAAPVQDWSEVATPLSIQGTDSCSAGNINVRYLLFLDLDADGVQETVLNSDNPPTAGLVNYGNALLPNYVGGTPTQFDNRPVPANEKWRFVLESPFAPNVRTGRVRWNTAQAPNVYQTPELPVGKHLIRWFLQDGCGNESTCEQVFSVLENGMVANQEPESEGFALFQNEPNPFSASTQIRFYLPEAATATLSVLDAEGRELYRQTNDYGQGSHAVSLHTDKLLSPGILFYRLQAGPHIAWRKMILLR